MKMRSLVRIVFATAGGLLGGWLAYILLASLGTIALEAAGIRGVAKLLVLAVAAAAALVTAVLVFRGLSSLSRGDIKTEATAADAFRKARAWAIGLSAVQLALLPFLTYPYWTEVLEGRFFYVTELGIAMYLFIWLVVAMGLYALVGVSSPGLSLDAALVLAILPALALVTKWMSIFLFESMGIPPFSGLELFHNREGLGREILGPIPNMFIDGCLCLPALGILALTWRLRGLSSRSVSKE